MVFLKLQPYRQTSVANRLVQKLAPKFYGSFNVLDRVGKIAYKLDLPPKAQIHNIFHVSQLKLAYGYEYGGQFIPLSNRINEGQKFQH